MRHEWIKRILGGALLFGGMVTGCAVDQYAAGPGRPPSDPYQYGQGYVGDAQTEQHELLPIPPAGDLGTPPRPIPTGEPIQTPPANPSPEA